MKSEAKIGVMCVQAKEYQGLLAAKRKAWNVFSL